jgi:hypothetical protein
MRVRPDATFARWGARGDRRTRVPGPGHAWVGVDTAFKHAQVRRRGALVGGWAAGHDAPWLVLTNLVPKDVGVGWYGLRVSGELGVRALRRLGSRWGRMRRTEAERLARH